MNTYVLIISVCSVIILSFLFNIVSKKTKIPSVLLLMALGVAAQGLVDEEAKATLSGILPIIGQIGLIMIVLEAALDLELEREKLPLIVKSLLVATVALVASSIAIAFIIQYMLPTDPGFTKALVYAIPLSIMSSAIIIPSVKSLSKDKQEFMVYESTFSDILGIMFFYFLVGSGESESNTDLVWSISKNIIITLLVAGTVAYGLVYIFQRLKSQVKLFLIIAVLMFMYAVGKYYHLSSLIIILAFGLVLNNTKIFFRGRLSKYVNEEATKPIMHDFHVLTLETAFVIRTFFFVIFGITISLATLGSMDVALISLAIIAALYLIRFISLKLFIRGSIMPQLLLAPRGLITILLFFGIISDHPEYIIPEFNSGILLYTIIISSVIMAISLILDRGENVRDVLIKNVKEFPKSLIPGRGVATEIERSRDRELDGSYTAPEARKNRD